MMAAMSDTGPSPRRQGHVSAPGFPRLAVSVLLVLCAAPLAVMFGLEAVLSRDCTIERARDGDAGGNLVWRIESTRCGDGPVVHNVLVGPRGKSLALVASVTGEPRPVEVQRDGGGVTRLLLDGETPGGGHDFLLALKATGRPAKPLVVRDGRPRS